MNSIKTVTHHLIINGIETEEMPLKNAVRLNLQLYKAGVNVQRLSKEILQLNGEPSNRPFGNVEIGDSL